MAVKAASLQRLLRPAAAIAGAGGLGAAIGGATTAGAGTVQPQMPPATPPDPAPETPREKTPGDARLAVRKTIFDRLRTGLGRTARKITAPYTGAPQ